MTPRYDQITISDWAKKDEFYQILSPNADDQGVWIHQDAWFNMADLSSGKELEYKLHREGSGVFIQLIEGNIEVSGNLLSGRDAISITESSSVKIKSTAEARVLVMEVPMHW